MEAFGSVLSFISHSVVTFVDATGAWGIFLLMALESANIPIPSEIIMPFGGFGASRGVINLWVVIMAGAIGNVAGSALSYWLGLRGGRPFLERFGRYFFVRAHDLERGDHYFKKYGVRVAFWSRLLPVVRTFVSLPAGINRAPFWPFIIFTFLGSFIWSAFLAYIGFWLGEQWEDIHRYGEPISFGILGLIVVAIIWYVWRHRRTNKITRSPH